MINAAVMAPVWGIPMAYVDRLGYLRCSDHADAASDGEPEYGFGITDADTCDSCGTKPRDSETWRRELQRAAIEHTNEGTVTWPEDD